MSAVLPGVAGECMQATPILVEERRYVHGGLYVSPECKDSVGIELWRTDVRWRVSGDV